MQLTESQHKTALEAWDNARLAADLLEPACELDNFTLNQADHGFCNTICKVVFAKPLPANTTEIVGMRNSDEAFKLCNPD